MIFRRKQDGDEPKEADIEAEVRMHEVEEQQDRIERRLDTLRRERDVLLRKVLGGAGG